MNLNTEILTLLEKQEVIESGFKAVVHRQVLYNDRIYANTGNIGRWMMNTFVRNEVTGRQEICDHIVSLVSSIEGVVSITCIEHALFEKNTAKLLLSIGTLMEIYPKLSSGDERPQTYDILEDCMVRLLHLHGTMSHLIAHGDETHV